MAIQITFQLILLFLVLHTKYSNYPTYIQRFLPGIGWPEYWTDEHMTEIIGGIIKSDNREEKKQSYVFSKWRRRQKLFQFFQINK